MRKMLSGLVFVAFSLAVVGLAAACTEEVVTEVVKEVVVEKEVIKEVPVTKEVVVEKEVIRTVEVEKPVEVIKEVIKEVPKTVVVEKEVVKEVEVEKEVEKIVEVIKEVEVEKIVEVEKVVEIPVGLQGGTLRTVSQASIKSLDRIWTTAFVTHVTSAHLYENLFTWDAEDRVKPDMVGDWSLSSDNLTYTFSLRDGITFHDGSAVTSNDVLASIDRWKQKSSHADLLFTRVDGLAEVDDNTFTLKLTEPYGLVLNALGDPIAAYMAIVPANLAATPATEQVPEWTGSGPYKFSSWNPGEKLILERYEGYVTRSEPGSFLAGARIANFDTIEYLEIPDVATKVAGLKTRQWDFVDGVGQDFYGNLQESDVLNIYLHKPGHEPIIVFNKTKAPFDNVKARQAVLAAVDVGAIMATYGDPVLWQTCAAVFYCGGRWETSVSEELYNQNDIDKGKALLAESGYDGSSVILMSPTDYSTIYPIGQIGKIGMEEIGLDVDFPALDWATLVTRRAQKDGYEMFTTWGAYWCCFDPIVSSLFSPTWFGWYESDRMAALRDDFARALTAKDKASIIDDVQNLFYEEVPFIHVGQFYSFDSGGKWLKGYQGKHFPVYWGAWLEK